MELGAVMYLLSVTLTNFKTHRDRNFEFQLGTNAICGANGAGKTSILEAIAWTLFNHRGSYKQEDFIRNGSGSAQARVAFVSSYDGRTYEVERCTSRGYTLFDPQLGERLNYSRIKDEVEPWLQQHLGVPPGTDLGQLFANTIGVPQGTFTADFLLSPEKRKPIFDGVLKVEEYRQVHKESNTLRRYAEAQVDLLKTQLQQYEEQLQTLDDLETRHDALVEEVIQGEKKLTSLQQKLRHFQESRQTLMVQREKIHQLQQQRQQLVLQLEAKHQAQQLMEQARVRSQQAAELCQTHTAAYRAYTEIEQALNSLANKNQQRLQLLQQVQTQQRSLDQQAATIARLQVQLEQREQQQKQISDLTAACKEQKSLEQQRLEVAKQQQLFVQLQLRRQALQERLARIQREHQQTEQSLQILNGLQQTVEQIPELEHRQQRWQQQLSRVEAAQQFEQELQQLVVNHRSQSMDYDQQVTVALEALAELQQSLPLLSSDLLDRLQTAIATGQSLSQTTLAALDSILVDLAAQVDVAQLQQQLKQGQTELRNAYDHRAQLSNREPLQKKQAELVGQQRQLQTEIADADQQLLQAAALDQRLQSLDADLQALGDPNGRRRVLQEQLQAMDQVKVEYDRLCVQRQGLEATLAALTQQLDEFKDVEDELAKQQQRRQNAQAGYLLYVQNEKDAQKLEQLTADLATVAQAVVELTRQRETLVEDLKQLTTDFEPEALQELEKQYGDVKSQCDRIAGSLPQQRKLQAELTKQLDTLRQVAEKRDQTTVELKQKERIKRFINFARKAYKEAGPRITERYV
ncbi:MAG: SMC family ATPase, partial [Cyanobacteria bacterium J06642_11]